MKIERYRKIRRCYPEFTAKIVDSDEDIGNVERAGKRLGILEGKTFMFEYEEETNVLIEYILFEKNGKKNSLVERYALRTDTELDESEKIILNGMLNSYFSVFEVNEIYTAQHMIELVDIVEEGRYILIDIGLSQSTSKGDLLCTRLLPIEEDVYMASGVNFGFSSDKRQKVLRNIPKKKKFRIRKSRLKLNAKKSDSRSLLERMVHVNRRWGAEVRTNEV